MKIYLYIDNEDLSDIAGPIAQAMTDWLTANGGDAKHIRLVNLPPDSEEETQPQRVSDWDLGLVMETSKKFNLKEPLNFLHKLAREYEQEFVVGHFDEQTGEPENVCYFGFEEGRPDLHEIASYLGMQR